MPLNAYVLQRLRQQMTALEAQPETKRRIAMFSCPDLIVPKSDLEQFLGRTLADEEVTWRPDGHDILRWHKKHDQITKIADTWWLFKQAGWDLECFDLGAYRGQELYANLDHPLKHRFWGRYDLLYDIVTNQCFRASTALDNTLRAVRPGGIIIHLLPVTQVNQGFWGVSPCLLEQFHEANGGKVLELALVRNSYEWLETYPYHYRRMRNLPDDVLILLMARRGEQPPMDSFTMKKFQEHPDSRTMKRRM